MENQPMQVNRIKPIFFYLKESIKFYDVDHPIVAQITFVLQLAAVFGGYILSRPYAEKFIQYYEQISNKLTGQLDVRNYDLSILSSELAVNMVNAFITVMLVYLVSRVVAYIISVFFGAYYFISLTRSETTPAQRISEILSKYPKIIIFNILFYGIFSVFAALLLVAVGMAMMILPLLAALLPLFPFTVLAVDTIFMFKNLLIVEFDTGVFRNFKKALDITKGCRRRVIANGLWPVCISIIISTFSLGIDNPLLSLFIAAFFEVIILMMTQRLTALMFIDAASLERNDKGAKEVKNAGQN